jgi:hypothetical protein
VGPRPLCNNGKDGEFVAAASTERFAIREWELMQQFDRVRRASNCNSPLSLPMLQRSRQSDEPTLRGQMGDAERFPQTSVMLAHNREGSFSN